MIDRTDQTTRPCFAAAHQLVGGRRRQLVSTFTALGIAAALGLAWLGADRAAVARPGAAHRNRYTVPFTPSNNLQYIDAIVPHHEHALEMAEMELEKGTRPEVQAIAQRMKEMQMAEIALLLAVREELTGHARVPSPPRDRHNEADMRRLAAATGAAVDSLFIQHMIPHHAEGISIAHRALPNLQRADLVENAKDVVKNQAMEIGELQALRTDENY